jgi:hypothetical protein
MHMLCSPDRHQLDPENSPLERLLIHEKRYQATTCVMSDGRMQGMLP